MANHKDAAEFVSVLLHSGTAGHLLHLTTKSYSEHQALGAYYDEIIDLVDKWAEAYQGHFGVIPLSEYPGGFKVQTDAKKYLNTLLDFSKGMRDELPKNTDLQNIHDEITGLIASTVYKLENLS